MALNLNTVKTPGVYIDEVSLLPPSVAPVETAIPAFVGFTDNPDPTLVNKPTKITSFLEYQQIFGGPPTPDNLITGGVGVTVQDSYEYVTDDANPPNVIDTIFLGREIKSDSERIRPDHNMFFAVRHYFDNGGGECWIVSTGNYGSLADGPLVSGINALEQEDEPTLIVIPEAHGLNTAAQYDNVYKTALDQCAKLMDRFTIIDVQQSTDAPNNLQ
ncbi:MAG: hypothetical protein AAFY91_18850, partial [Bacteroidota bacterium]